MARRSDAASRPTISDGGPPRDAAAGISAAPSASAASDSIVRRSSSGPAHANSPVGFPLPLVLPAPPRPNQYGVALPPGQSKRSRTPASGRRFVAGDL